MAPYTTAGVPGLFFRKKIKAFRRKSTPYPESVELRGAAMVLDAPQAVTTLAKRNEEDLEIKQGLNDNQIQSQSVDGLENQVLNPPVNGTETDTQTLQQPEDPIIRNQETESNPEKPNSFNDEPINTPSKAYNTRTNRPLLHPIQTSNLNLAPFPTPPQSAVSQLSSTRKRKRAAYSEELPTRKLVPVVVIETPTKKRRTEYEEFPSLPTRRLTPVVLIETPKKQSDNMYMRETRSSARRRRELEASLVPETPITTKFPPTPPRTTSPLKICDDISNSGPDQPATEILVSPEDIKTCLVHTPSSSKSRKTAKPSAVTSSPHFPTSSHAEISSPTTNKKKKRKPSTISPNFSSAVEKKPKPQSQRAPAGVRILPWPPLSAERFGLVQEELRHNPFQLLIATTFLNRTKGSVARPLLDQFLKLYPTPEKLAEADQKSVEKFMQPLGLYRVRADRMIKMAKEMVLNPISLDEGKETLTVLYNYPPRDTRPFPIPGKEPCGVQQKLQWEIAHLPGVGAYALDSWRIFCRDDLRGRKEGEEEEWKRVVPKDKELRAYCRWLWAKEGVTWEEEGDGLMLGGRMIRAEEGMDVDSENS